MVELEEDKEMITLAEEEINRLTKKMDQMEVRDNGQIFTR